MGTKKDKMRVLVAGIGGASLGTEIIKSLQAAGNYDIYGCDISPFAFGHYQDGVNETFLVDHENYVNEVLRLCHDKRIEVVVPGGEEPTLLLAAARRKLEGLGATLAANSSDVVRVCSDKEKLFRLLADHNVPIPRLLSADQLHRLNDLTYPCVIKPSTASGGSSFVFLAADRQEAELYVAYLLRQEQVPLVQEYIRLDEGEYTIGVLHAPDGALVGSVALRRMFHAKLSVMAKTKSGLISSGYSQGLIDDFPEIRKQAEVIASLLQSRGPLNIQGRVENGVLLPFEINPRFSASTFLRTLAGFNEVDIYLQALVRGVRPSKTSVKAGYYLRSLSEVVVEMKGLVQ